MRKIPVWSIDGVGTLFDTNMNIDIQLLTEKDVKIKLAKSQLSRNSDDAFILF